MLCGFRIQPSISENLKNSEILGVFGTENYFRLASTFNASLLKLTGDGQKAVKTTALDLQLDPANPGMSYHKLDKAKDN